MIFLRFYIDLAVEGGTFAIAQADAYTCERI